MGDPVPARRMLTIAVGIAVAVAVVATPLAPAVGQTKLVMVFNPILETEVVLFSGQQIGRMLTTSLGIPVEAVVATSYAATILAMCSGRADLAFLSPFAYVLAHEKCGIEVAAVSVRSGRPYYRGMIVVRADAGISKLEDLRGKRFAFVDPVSTSGYLFPAAMLKGLGYDPDRFFSDTFFAGTHPNVVLAVYRGQVDGGATFEDVRTSLLQQFPDVMQKVKPLLYTSPIPQDTWSLNPKLSQELKQRIRDRLVRIAETGPGKEALRNLYGIEGIVDRVELTAEQIQQLGVRFPPEVAENIVRRGDKVSVPVGDWYFQVVRDAANSLGLDLQKLVK